VDKTTASPVHELLDAGRTMKYTVNADAEAEISLAGEHEHAKETPRTIIEVSSR